MISRWHVTVGLFVIVTLLTAGPVPAGAQSGTVSVRVALVQSWTVNQHRQAAIPGGRGALATEFRNALDRGVVDRVVFWWQRGVIQRRALVWKPIRVLAGPEASALGGRGEFQLDGVKPPAGGAAWTEVDVAPRTTRADDVLVLEVGGELNTMSQVLETVFVASPSGSLVELTLAPRALIRSDGVPVLAVPFGRPVVVADGAALFRGAGGAEFLVARSPIEASVNGDITPNGFADLSPFQTAAGEWREGDRVFVRVPLAALRAGAPAVVLGWKDRTPRPGGEGNELRRSSRLDGLPFR